MRSISRNVGVGLVALLVALLGTRSAATAGSCGDANRSGTVTVTDGVLILRAAAQLPGTICPRERCDMNLDNALTVTDGVLALRVAAGIQTSTSCSSAQVDALFGRITKTIGRGGSQSSAAARARAANTTTPCSFGGSESDDGTTLTFDQCAEDDVVTNGTIVFTVVGDNAVDADFATSDFTPSTGETVQTTGTLHFTFFDDGTSEVDGDLSYDSSIVGTYDTEFATVLFDTDGATTSGDALTTIDQGQDVFANLSSIDITMYSPTLREIGVAYADGEFDLFVDAENLCEPCTSSCTNDSLTCVSCGDECSNDTDRCGIDFNFVDCDDGVFGPPNLCEPCNSNADCDASDGLSCFPCDHNCTGSISRCSSSKAFAECEDGEF